LEPVIEPVDDAGASSSTQAVDCVDQEHTDATDTHVGTIPATEAEDPFLSNLFSPGVTETLPATTATGAPAGASNRFAMHFEWLPSDKFFERCRTARVNIQRIEPVQQEKILGEFRSYWESQQNLETQAQWEHKLICRLQWWIDRPTGNAPGQPASRQQKRAAVTAAIMDINDTDW
jgi:hypothetical protein